MKAHFKDKYALYLAPIAVLLLLFTSCHDWSDDDDDGEEDGEWDSHLDEMCTQFYENCFEQTCIFYIDHETIGCQAGNESDCIDCCTQMPDLLVDAGFPENEVHDFYECLNTQCLPITGCDAFEACRNECAEDFLLTENN